MTSEPLLRLNPAMNVGPAAERLARTGRTQLPDVLTGDSARRLVELMKGAAPWTRSISISGRGADVPVTQFDAQAPGEQQRLLDIVWSEARDGFQYLFDRVRITEGRVAGAALPPLFTALDDLLNGEDFLETVRRLTGDEEIAFLDCQATRYLPGHFLTGHNDKRDEHGRRFAYVLNLAPRWRADWGGLLQFHRPDGTVEEGLVPFYNHLSVFRVPQWHSVSIVAPFAGEPRLAVTGWMRTNRV
ncbi:2OG-Fe(II) oxygenase family protein [Brevundimonas sp. 2R-24]|uniref:2OG-Fe(II) oxygenase family protein n=1 Tax=Peiella sedimenti TaxID=3061083 RepID=A0ABT8SL05_9CAUL|nr:2OG-Fe(II) oxygenase family protein [Caulobacteraceae bacterium XZ-24]